MRGLRGGGQGQCKTQAGRCTKDLLEGCCCANLGSALSESKSTGIFLISLLSRWSDNPASVLRQISLLTQTLSLLLCCLYMPSKPRVEEKSGWRQRTLGPPMSPLLVR